MQLTLLIGGIGLVLAGDGYLFATRGYDATITAAVRSSPGLSGFIGLGLGYLICHFWG